MKKKYHTIGTVPKSNRYIAKIDILTHITPHFHGLVQAFQ